jgi:hypothetical protein
VLIAACNTEKEENIVTPNNYIKIIEGIGVDDPIAIRTLSDGNLLVVTNSVSFEQGEQIRKIRLLKLNLEGNIINQEYLPDNEQSWLARDVIRLESNEILLASTIQNQIGTDSALLFLKIDENFETLASMTYENNATYDLLGVEESNDEILFIAQETSELESYPLIGRLNAADLALEEVKEAFRYDVAPATKVFRNEAGEYVWAYNRNRSYLTKVRPNLLQVNEQEISLSAQGFPQARKLIMLDGNPIIFGEVQNNDRTQLFYYNQNTASSFLFGSIGNTLLNNVQRTENGFLVCGYQDLQIEGSENRQRNFFLSRRNESGGEIFSKTFGGNENEELSDALMINNGIYTIGKTVFGGENTLVLIKTDAFGQLKN